MRIIFTLLMLIWLFFHAMNVLFWVRWSLPLAIAGEYEGWPGAIAYLAIVVASTAFGLWWIFRAVDFYERGAVARLFWLRRVFPYADVANLHFEFVRLHYGFVSQFTRIGTRFKMVLTMRDGRKLRFDEPYVTRPLGARRTVRGRTFEGDAEIDIVRDVIRMTITHGSSSSFPQKHYYVVAAGKEKGPYTRKQLRAGLDDETLSRMTLVRTEDDAEPQRLGELLS